MKCWWCEKELHKGLGGYYERWSLAMLAHIAGYLCVECYDKKWLVRIKRFFNHLWKNKI
ncbi:hypothetical protein LCGC14_0422930 [marine sediment metagenome]|uniref:Uncharacterized protein n=1 Tax=marine sediment metagenome TaxID=412755 RepID=A0A0F9SQE4_9ZZZZ